MDPRLQVVLNEQTETANLSSVQRINLNKLVRRYGGDSVIAGVRKGVSSTCLKQLKEPQPNITKLCPQLQGQRPIIESIQDAFKSSDQRIRAVSQSNLKQMQTDIANANTNFVTEYKRQRIRDYLSGNVGADEMKSDLVELGTRFVESNMEAFAANPIENTFRLFALLNQQISWKSPKTKLVVGSVAALATTYYYLQAKFPGVLKAMSFDGFSLNMLTNPSEFYQWWNGGKSEPNGNMQYDDWTSETAFGPERGDWSSATAFGPSAEKAKPYTDAQMRADMEDRTILGDSALYNKYKLDNETQQEFIARKVTAENTVTVQDRTALFGMNV